MSCALVAQHRWLPWTALALAVTLLPRQHGRTDVVVPQRRMGCNKLMKHATLLTARRRSEASDIGPQARQAACTHIPLIAAAAVAFWLQEVQRTSATATPPLILYRAPARSKLQVNQLLSQRKLKAD